MPTQEEKPTLCFGAGLSKPPASESWEALNHGPREIIEQKSFLLGAKFGLALALAAHQSPVASL